MALGEEEAKVQCTVKSRPQLSNMLWETKDQKHFVKALAGNNEDREYGFRADMTVRLLYV